MKNINKYDSFSFYQKVGKRQGWSFETMKYEKYSSKDFDYYGFLSKEIKSTDVVLDIGCGDSKKVIKYVNAKEIIGIDNSPEMLKKSRENWLNAKNNSKHSFLLMNGFGKLEFEDNTFDFVINRHCGCNINEMHRVLKPNGIYIQEDIDETDCLELKFLFGRGQNYPITSFCSDEFKKQYSSLNFSQIEYFPIREVEYYKTKEDLKYLLENTPIIQNFGEGKDDECLFNQYCATHQTPEGIRLDRGLYGFILRK